MLASGRPGTLRVEPCEFQWVWYASIPASSGKAHVGSANAGHDPPYSQRGGDAQELRARGMPLGLMPDMPYEEKEAVLAVGDDLLLYSDGLVEAHDTKGDMFGFPRLRRLIMAQSTGSGEELIDVLLAELTSFTGTDAEQEDDITLVTLERSKARMRDLEAPLQPDA